ncbi:MAG: GxxExxY protein [Labilithrix sp.]|nr:GxxExxY protein [Labilithrix sp.]
MNAVSEQVVLASIEVHRLLGPGLLESAYQEALAFELTLVGVTFVKQPVLAPAYKGHALPSSYRADFIVEDLVVVELKAVDQVLPVHAAQLLTYLRVSGHPVGLLINFNVPLLRYGIRRLANKAPNLPPR